jgi:hypothetical protein
MVEYGGYMGDMLCPDRNTPKWYAGNMIVAYGRLKAREITLDYRARYPLKSAGYIYYTQCLDEIDRSKADQ